jgi:hypothetical protein
LSLAAERLDRHHHSRRPVPATEYGAEAATDGLERAAGEKPEQSSLPAEQPSKGSGDRKDVVRVVNRSEDFFPQLLGPQLLGEKQRSFLLT